MADIQFDFPIQATARCVFEAISTPRGLDLWWTKRSSGVSESGSEYELWFGEPYDWRARVVSSLPDREFELQLTRSDADWNGTRVGFRLEPRGAATLVHFRHTGWPNENDHFRTSTFCWAMYLRILRRNLEHGEVVPYEQRLDV